MLALESIGIQFGGRKLFEDLNLSVKAGDRIALAGPNGAGKSTLLKIIAGLQSPDLGRLRKARTITIGYLPQEGVDIRGRTLYAEAETAFADVLELQRQLDEAGEALGRLESGTPAYDEALEAFGDLQIRLEHHDVSRMRPRIETVLTGLGFSHGDLERQTSEFSGGWQMRIALAKLLLQEPSVLLLDEPTNHLDIETVQWLEQYLRAYPGALILISHDRAFLDNLTNRTYAFESGRVEIYSGNYSYYLRERKERRAQLERQQANQQREIDKTKQFIDRFRAKATKARQVQSRIKQLNKIELIELDDEDAEIDFHFPQPPPSGQTVLRLEGVTKEYQPGLPVLKDLDYTVDKGDRIAIVGVNGAGKSTFAKLLAGALQPTAGNRSEGHKVSIAYYSQDHADSMDPGRNVLATAEEGITGAAAAQIRTLLGCFLFRGDDVFKQVAVLSGGERGRLALARLLLTPANFLILDEPTNHLDMRSQAVLQRALAEYTGTYVIVSHNRDFLDPVVNKVLEFLPGQPPRLFLGNVSDYLAKKAEEKAVSLSPAGAPAAGGGPDSSSARSSKERRRQEAVARQQRNRVLRPLQEELEQVEGKISDLEQEKTGLARRFQDPSAQEDAELMKATAQRYQQAEQELERAFSRWSELSTEIERLEAAG